MPKDLNRGLGVNFNPTMQDGFINNRGVDMIHEIGVSCTCRVADVYGAVTNDGKQHRSAFCSRCGGDGWLFRSPLLVRGIITNVRHQRNVIDAGLVQPGDALFGPMSSGSECAENSDRAIGAFDKLTATWPEPLSDGHVLIRGAGIFAANEGINTSLSDNEDRLWYEPASAIWCEDENDFQYKEGTDFVLGPGKIIRWIGNSPPLRTKYSIKYNAYFEWIVFQSPGERRDVNAINLGELVFLRKRHIALVNESPFATNTDKISLQSAMRC